MIEALRSSHVPLTIGAAGATALLLTGCSASVSIGTAKAPDAIKTYEEKYTAPDKCLDMSPFDLEFGAEPLLIREDDGAMTLKVVPESANSYNPSVLVFKTNDNGKTLVSGDSATSFFLTRCTTVEELYPGDTPQPN